jgi:trehalose utilization protein
VFWSHGLHEYLSDEAANRVVTHVQNGMGVVFLHSAHTSKPFRRLLGTSCNLKWREAEERERLWFIDPTHPIAQGLPECIVIPREEMYGEPFDIPTPDELVAIGWFKGGEVFRSVCCYKRGLGKVVYIQPGHESYPVYAQPEIQKLIENAVRYVAPVRRVEKSDCIWAKDPQEAL